MSSSRSAVVVAAMDISQANTVVQILSVFGQYLAQPHLWNCPQHAEVRRCRDAVVAMFASAGEKLTVQLGLEQMNLEPAGKPLLVLGATDSARQLLDGMELTDWLALELEGEHNP